ncbi:MAG: DUF1295 domain-containing protein [Polyangiaceae bacterium]
MKRSRVVYTLAYVVAIALALGVALLTRAALGPIGSAIAGGGAATLLLYATGLLFRNSGFYDVYWSVFPPLAAAAWCTAYGAWSSPRALAAFGMATLWGGRLTLNWATHWEGLAHEDWRYVDLRKKTGRLYWLASFGALHVFPFALVTLGSLPLAAAIQSKDPFGALDAVAVAVNVVAVLLETIADLQLHAYRRANHPRDQFLQTGLWAYSRHPNYCGEVLAWWSFAILGLAADPKPWLVLGAAGVTGMVVGASIPMAEARALAKRPAFADYQRRVSRLIPWFPKK